MKRSVYTDDDVAEAVAESQSVMQVLEKLGIKKAGGSHSHMSARIKRMGLDTSHFLGRGSNKGRAPVNKRTSQEVLVRRPPGSNKEKTVALRRAMLDSGVGHTCSICGILDEWNGLGLTLEVDHIDGDWHNNLIENLRFLCPNCHSQQWTTNRPHKSRMSV